MATSSRRKFCSDLFFNKTVENFSAKKSSQTGKDIKQATEHFQLLLLAVAVNMTLAKEAEQGENRTCVST
jgi:hypothetical protein